MSAMRLPRTEPSLVFSERIHLPFPRFLYTRKLLTILLSGFPHLKGFSFNFTVWLCVCALYAVIWKNEKIAEKSL